VGKKFRVAQTMSAVAAASANNEAAIEWPKKTTEMHNHHMNSEMWAGFAFRDDDIVIATYAKSGTTWLQQIVGQLVFNGETTHEGQGELKNQKSSFFFFVPVNSESSSKVSLISRRGWIFVCHRKKSKFQRSTRRSIAAS
jgi:hypothetical protein